LARATKGTSAPAYFATSDAKQRFTDLRTGSEDDFLAAADSLTQRLHTAMDERAKKGFIVAVRRSSDPNGPAGIAQVGVLKLDIHDEPAAAAREIEDELTLEAVQGLLDLPGELQKGAVYPDPRADSDLVVGDRVMVETAKYFLRSLDVQQIAAAGSATKSFVEVVAKVAPAKLDDVVEELDGYDHAISPTAFLAEHPELLDEHEREETLQGLEGLTRPVRIIDVPTKPPRVVVSADGISIRGAVMDMHKVTWHPSNGGWQIQIDVSEEPRKSYE